MSHVYTDRSAVPRAIQITDEIYPLSRMIGTHGAQCANASLRKHGGRGRQRILAAVAPHQTSEPIAPVQNWTAALKK